MPKLRSVYASAYALVVALAVSSCARPVPYVQTTGPNGYWNAHVDFASGLIYIAQPGHPVTSAKFNPSAPAKVDTSRGQLDKHFDPN